MSDTNNFWGRITYRGQKRERSNDEEEEEARPAQRRRTNGTSWIYGNFLPKLRDFVGRGRGNEQASAPTEAPAVPGVVTTLGAVTAPGPATAPEATADPEKATETEVPAESNAPAEPKIPPGPKAPVSRRERVLSRLGYSGGGDGADDRLLKSTIDEYRAKGIEYEKWIADTSTVPCPIQPSVLTVNTLLNNPIAADRYQVISFMTNPPFQIEKNLEEAGLPGSTEEENAGNYRCTDFARYKNPSNEVCKYIHSTAQGVIIAEDIRREGQQAEYWSDVALAVYRHDYDPNTLKYIYFVDIANDQTLPFIRRYLYPKKRLALPGARDMEFTETKVWKYHSKEYQQILGTRLGAGVACVVLGNWQSGTHRIARIHTWFCHTDLQMRFDIEEV